MGTFQPHHQRNRQFDHLGRLDDPFGDHVTFHDPAEDIHQDRFHLRIGQEDLKSRGHLFHAGAPADVQEIRRAGSFMQDHVHRSHSEAGAVHQAPDAPVQADIVQAVFRSFIFFWVFLKWIPERGDLRMTEERIVIEIDLGVQA